MAFQSPAETPEVLSTVWTIKFIQDTATTGIGTTIATKGTVTYSRQVNTNLTGDIDAFVAEAQAAFAAVETQNSTQAPVIADITARINA